MTHSDRPPFVALLDELCVAYARFRGSDSERAALERAYWHALAPYPLAVVRSVILAAIADPADKMPAPGHLRAACKHLDGNRPQAVDIERSIGAAAAARTTDYLRHERPYVLVVDDDRPEDPANSYPWDFGSIWRHRRYCERLPEWDTASGSGGLPVPPCLHWYDSGTPNCPEDQLKKCVLAARPAMTAWHAAGRPGAGTVSLPPPPDNRAGPDK